MNKTQKKALSPEEAAALYSIPAGTLGNLRSRREGPKFFKVGRRVVYMVEDFESWLRRNPVLTKDSIEG